MMYVRAKKALGQHFLKDESIARRITDSLLLPAGDVPVQVLEIGPGTGVLTKYLLENRRIRLQVAEIDPESVECLKATFPQLLYTLRQQDFLTMPLDKTFDGDFSVIGNFPYNISSQIFFRILEYKEHIPQIVCMLQKEVAERLAGQPGTKTYGILSVLLQTWYDIEYLFTVGEHVFLPPPKVKSAVIRLRKNGRDSLGCDEKLFKQVVKATFNQRRKTIRNSVKPLLCGRPAPANDLLEKRPEQLSIEQFAELTRLVSETISGK